MRERNNEASKRCRLKRRLKADTVEQQAHNLSMSNKFLRQRISKLEKICVVLKDGVKRIQSKDCGCLDTVAKLKKTNADCEDISNLSNRALIKSSVAHRTVNADFLAAAAQHEAVAAAPAPAAGPSLAVKEELPSPPELPQLLPEQPTQLPQLPTAPTVEVRPTPPSPVCITFPGRSELSVTPVSKVAVVTSAASSSSSFSTAAQPKTALDVINDTIIQSLRSNSNASSNIVTAPCVPLNLVKVVPTSNQQTPIPPTTAAKQIILVTTPPVAGRQPIAKEEVHSVLGYNAGKANQVVVKCEPEVQIVKREAARANGEGIAVGAMEDTEDEEEEGVDPTLPCIAATHNGYTSGCSGELVNLNKLSSYLDLISRNVARDNGRAAMERAIIKSRLRVPFWQADEVKFRLGEST